MKLKIKDYKMKKYIFTMKKISTIKSKAEARNVAWAWQIWQSKRNMSYAEMSLWLCYFEKLAEKFHLEEEFKENCII